MYIVDIKSATDENGINKWMLLSDFLQSNVTKTAWTICYICWYFQLSRQYIKMSVLFIFLWSLADLLEV